MKNRSLFVLAAALAPFFFYSCGSPASGPTSYKTIPLKEYGYTPASISSGTEINILGYSGGKENKNGSVYYSQFIGVREGSDDTVRILAAWIGVPSDTGSTPILTPVSMFDGQKGIHTATFLIPDDNQRMMMRMGAGLPETEAIDTATISKAINDTAVAKNEFVILQDEVPLFKGKYKTAIGLMNFKQQPW